MAVLFIVPVAIPMLSEQSRVMKKNDSFIKLCRMQYFNTNMLNNFTTMIIFSVYDDSVFTL